MKKSINLVYLRHGLEGIKGYSALDEAIEEMDNQFYRGYSARQAVIDYENKTIFLKDDDYIDDITCKDEALESFLVRVI